MSHASVSFGTRAAYYGGSDQERFDVRNARDSMVLFQAYSAWG